MKAVTNIVPRTLRPFRNYQMERDDEGLLCRLLWGGDWLTLTEFDIFDSCPRCGSERWRIKGCLDCWYVGVDEFYVEDRPELPWVVQGGKR